MSKNSLTAIIAIVFLGVCLFFVGKYYFRPKNKEVPAIVEKVSHKVMKIGILSGDEFDLKLAVGQRVKIKLTVTATHDSKEQVVRFINGCSNPRVILLHKSNNVWIADLFLYVKETGKEVSLAEWLKFNNLASDL